MKSTLVLAALGVLAAISSFHRSVDMVICALLLGAVGAVALWALLAWAFYAVSEWYECVRPHERLPGFAKEEAPSDD